MDKLRSSDESHEGPSERDDDEIPPYSEQEAAILAEKLADRETFTEAWKIVIAWLKKGEFNDSNGKKFSSLTQLCFGHEQKLKDEQIEKLKRVKEELAKQNCAKHSDSNELENDTKASQNFDFFSNFSKIQTEKIQAMRRDLPDIKRVFMTDYIFGQTENDESDSDS